MVTTRSERQITWSQGQILPPEAALAFQLIAAEQAATHLPVVYRLGITVLYASALDEPKAYAAATTAAEALEEIFARAFERSGGAREYIDLRYCDPVSDAVLTVQQREQLTEWRLEYLSLAADPPHPMVTE